MSDLRLFCEWCGTRGHLMGNKESCIRDLKQTLMDVIAERDQEPTHECPSCGFDNFPAYQKLLRSEESLREELRAARDLIDNAERIIEFYNQKDPFLVKIADFKQKCAR